MNQSPCTLGCLQSNGRKVTHHSNCCPKLQVENATIAQLSNAVLLSLPTSATFLSTVLAILPTCNIREELQLSDDPFADMTEAEFAELDALIAPSKWLLNIND